tara:strand:- start:10747 stop:11241 length:495 start_codon:yes stop_codon:yes gene_type:complete
MSVIDKLLKLYNVLDVEEKQEFLTVCSRNAKSDGVITDDDIRKASKAPIKGSVATYPSKGGKKPPFWVKEIKEIDDTKRGMFRIVGDWLYVNKPCSEKKLCVLGFKSNHTERKSYVIGFTDESEFEVENSKTGYKAYVHFKPMSREFDTFADVEKEAKIQLKML